MWKKEQEENQIEITKIMDQKVSLLIVVSGSFRSHGNARKRTHTGQRQNERTTICL
jgi:hypothetical protein